MTEKTSRRQPKMLNDIQREQWRQMVTNAMVHDMTIISDFLSRMVHAIENDLSIKPREYQWLDMVSRTALSIEHPFPRKKRKKKVSLKLIRGNRTF